MRTITWDDETAVVKLIDQMLLPAEYRIIACARVDELIAAIQQLQVRGAPALGAAGAFGVVLACLHARTATEFEHQLELLRTALSSNVKRPLQSQQVPSASSTRASRSAAFTRSPRSAFLSQEAIFANWRPRQ